MSTILLPQTIGDGRIDIFLKLLRLSQGASKENEICLDWRRTLHITPAGEAVLAVLFDTFLEQKTKIKNINILKKLSRLPVVKNLLKVGQFKELPNPGIHDFETTERILKGATNSIELSFTESLREKFFDTLSEELLFACTLTINELMQNSVDHSTAERYYLYAGLWKGEFHIGLLDMGITIPAKLTQKYACEDDLAFLELALQKGSSTRRIRTGGFGLYYFFEFLKESLGKLTIVSRNAQIRRYFKTRKSQKNLLKYPLHGTWCFARFPLEKNNAKN